MPFIPATLPGATPDVVEDEAPKQTSGFIPAPLPRPDESNAGEQEKPERESDLIKSATRGLKNSLAPFLLEKEDFSAERTKGELATEMGVGMASDIAATAATGAAIGSIVPGAGTIAGGAAGAVIATVSWALYRGFGYEAARSAAQNEDFNPLRGALNVAAEVNPLVSKGGRILKFATQAGLEMAKEYSYTKDTAAAGLSGVLGGGFAALFHSRGPGWFTSLAPVAAKPSSTSQEAGVLKSQVAGLQNLFSDQSPARLGEKMEAAAAAAAKDDPGFFNYRALLGKVDEATKGALDPIAGKEADEVFGAAAEELSKFKKWVIDQPGMGGHGDDVEALFAHAQHTYGMDGIDNAYKWYKLQGIALDEATKYNAQVSKGLDPDMPDPNGTGYVDKLRDILFVTRRIDKKLGTNFEGAVGKFTEAHNKQSVLMTGYLDDANKLVHEMRKHDIKHTDIGEALASGTKLTGKAEEIRQGWAGLFESARKGLEKEGMKIDFIAGKDSYLPMAAKSGYELHASMRKEIADLIGAHGEDFLEAADSQGIRKVAAKLLSTSKNEVSPGDITSRNQIENALKKALDPAAKKLSGFEASASFKRGAAEIPAFIQEKDVGKLFSNYLNNSFKSIVYQDAFLEMNSQIAMLKKMKFNNSADYLERYMQHVSGVPSNWMADKMMKANQYKAAVQVAVEKAPEGSWMRKMLEAKRDVPDFIGFAVGQIYPNFLGFNMRAAVRNYFQPLLTTAPELGWGYGSKMVLKSTIAAVRDIMSGVDVDAHLQAHNLAPGKFFGEAGDISGGGLRAIKGVGQAVEFVDKYNKAAMWLYGKSDGINRYITFKVGEQLAKDIAEGKRPALDFVTRTLSEGGKSQARALIAAAKGGSQDGVEKLGAALAKNLIGKTQFNYGKEAMNEWGREHGRLFSMFTKWPAMIMGDMGELKDTHGLGKGTIKIAQRYMAPMAILFGAGAAINSADNPMARWLIGSDLSDAAPMQSMKVGAPPLLKVGGDFTKTFLDTFSAELSANQKLRSWGKFAGNTAKAFTPGMAVPNEVSRIKKAFTND